MRGSAGDLPQEGLRQRKRRETLRRITDAGMKLFMRNGFDETTLDDIAAAAGISRRTFFSYFKSKDEILLSMVSGLGELVVAAMDEAPSDKRPLEVVRDAMVQICARIPADEMIAIDRIMRSSATVQARKQATYVQHEQTLFDALRRRWPEPDRVTGLRLVAAMAISALRISTDTLSREGGKRPLAKILREAFDAVQKEA